MVKNLPAIWVTWIYSLGREDPLEKGMATHSSILAWGIPWTEKPGGLQSIGSLSRARPRNRGLLARGTNTRLRLEFLRETGPLLAK